MHFTILIDWWNHLDHIQIKVQETLKWLLNFASFLRIPDILPWFPITRASFVGRLALNGLDMLPFITWICPCYSASAEYQISWTCCPDLHQSCYIRNLPLVGIRQSNKGQQSTLGGKDARKFQIFIQGLKTFIPFKHKL